MRPEDLPSLVPCPNGHFADRHTQTHTFLYQIMQNYRIK